MIEAEKNGTEMEFCLQNDSCEIRFARSQDEIIKAQSLRYHVFYELMSAVPNEECFQLKRDIDPFDDICDHLLVIDKSDPNKEEVVGNYRLLNAPCHKNADYFYSHQEYNIEPILEQSRVLGKNILELGRSCVHPNYRNNSIIQMLWRGIATYATRQDIAVLFGCASFSGTDLSSIKDLLSFLYHEKLAPSAWRATAKQELYVDMNLIEKSLDANKVMAKMPPLIKGYLRLGAWIGEGAVIDEQFSTTDILIILPMHKIKKRYLDFFARE